MYAAMAKRLRKEEANDPQLPFWLMTLSYGTASQRGDGEVVQGDVGGAGGKLERRAKRRQVMHAADPMWMRVFLGVHIAAGASSFLLAPVALVTAKGGKQHKRWGMVYLWSMGVWRRRRCRWRSIGRCCFWRWWRCSVFIWLFGVSSAAAEGAGAGRECEADRLDRGGDYVCDERLPGWVWCVSAGDGCSGWGSWRLCLGLSGCALRRRQMRKFVRKPKEKMFWWYTHLGNLIGSYIAAWSAFSVVTLPRVFGNHVVCVAVADDGWRSGDCVDDGVLQAEVCSAGEGSGVG